LNVGYELTRSAPAGLPQNNAPNVPGIAVAGDRQPIGLSDAYDSVASAAGCQRRVTADKPCWVWTILGAATSRRKLVPPRNEEHKGGGIVTENSGKREILI